MENDLAGNISTQENEPRVKSVEDWRRVLKLECERQSERTDEKNALDILKYFYGSTNHESCCKFSDSFFGWGNNSTNSVLMHFNKRVAGWLKLEDQFWPNGEKRYWNIANKFDEESNKKSPFVLLRLRPELVKAIELEFPDWEKNIIEPAEKIERELQEYKKKYKPLEDSEIVLTEMPINIISEKAFDEVVDGDKINQAPNYTKKAIAEAFNSSDGRKVELRVYEEECKRLKGRVPESVLKKMKDFFEKRKDSDGYDVLSYDIEKGREKYIEVKSTRRDIGAPFELSINQINFARKHKKDYYIYRVSVGKGMHVISGEELFRNHYLKPEKFAVYGYPVMTKEKALKLVDRLEWTFAKSFAKTAPHEYAIVKVGEKYRSEVVAFMKFIFENGVVESFYGKPFTVYYLGDRKYWSMASDKDHVSDDNYVLNRTVIETTNKIYE